MASTTKDVISDLSPIINVYTDGTVERLLSSAHVPPSPEDPTTGVSSKDTTISPTLSARLYLPKLTHPTQKLPILVYYHGGGFCVDSAFSFLNHRYVNSLVRRIRSSGCPSSTVSLRKSPSGGVRGFLGRPLLVF
ncbi:2-hydroxyisoflavanone dehydratase [Sesamum angolense]|uniref:2-hydroxyisoflavanone dehydratase n=1 Tax=Sesamum angolense TaxID=2727404 RepID=A0AAE1T3T4_9LAMI|nr:2-hydroxyisoflavanone dehydratase [Sesamum angolense]